jgi:hypothetical protein
MHKRINPFRPNSPVNPGMFVGRIEEIERLESSLVQTRADQPAHFIITGERGIGKTSLMTYIRCLAQGSIVLENLKFKFLVIDVDIDRNTTQLGLIRRIECALTSELGKSEPARHFLADAWSFLKRLEVAGTKLNASGSAQCDEVLADEFANSFAAVTQRMCMQPQASGFADSFEGILVLIDEADNSSSALQLGSFLKLLLERLQRRDCNRVLVGIAGLPEVRAVLHNSHPSSLRLFEEHCLNRLSQNEVRQVLDVCIAHANDLNDEKVALTPSARDLVTRISEGYPHFIQQFGYSAFAMDVDCSIDEDDVIKGAFAPRGAMDLIGDRYYRNDFYNRIQNDSYRQVLRIMAEQNDSWVNRAHIKKHFKGTTSVLSNAIKALRDRHIILGKEGQPGVYRFQHRGFALWIKLCAQPTVVESLP